MNNKNKLTKELRRIKERFYNRSEPSKEKGEKRAGFTLIELIVVMAVIAILVLLAAPKFLGYTQKAEETKMKNDIRVVEEVVEEYLMRQDVLPENGDEKTKDELKALNIYDAHGIVSLADVIDDGPYRLIDEEILEQANTNLKGNFYGNDRGRIYYESLKVVTNEDVETPVVPPVESPAESPVESPVEEPVVVDPLIPQGEGTVLNPYQIMSLEHLAYINTNGTTRAANYVMMRSLDFNNDAHYVDISNKTLWTTGEGWMPIGFSSVNPLDAFTGNFNGSGNTITGLYVNRTTINVGLFGFIKDGTVENLGITNGSIAGNVNVGGLAGRIGNATISDTYTTGTVTGNSSIGGLVGLMGSGTIEQSYTTGAVTAIDSSVGGIVGDFLGGTVINSYSTGVISGDSYVGGIAGYFDTGYLTNSYSISEIIGASEVGGLVGDSMADQAVITSTYAQSTVNEYGWSVIMSEADFKSGDSSKFAGWDSAIWTFTAGQYPKLK